MTRLASIVFLILTPHTSQSVGAGNRVDAAGRSYRDYVTFVEAVENQRDASSA